LLHLTLLFFHQRRGSFQEALQSVVEGLGGIGRYSIVYLANTHLTSIKLWKTKNLLSQMTWMRGGLQTLLYTHHKQRRYWLVSQVVVVA
jgi:hypothetical protein